MKFPGKVFKNLPLKICHRKFATYCHPMKTCARGPALLVTGEWDSMFNTVGNSGNGFLAF